MHDVVLELLGQGAAMAVSISGGKDGQAMLRHIHGGWRTSWTGNLYTVHADLGRAEWPQTPAVVEAQARAAGLELRIVHRSDGRDLVDHIDDRRQKLLAAGNKKPFWPSSASRYCTSDLKRAPIDGDLRRHELVICAIGVRGQESRKRAQKPVLALRKTISAEWLLELAKPIEKGGGGYTLEQVVEAWLRNPRGRLALDWNAVHPWLIEQVWEGCGTSLEEWRRRGELWRAGRREEALKDWPAHPAYAMGNERLSCAICVLGSENDIRNGLLYGPPELGRTYIGWERAHGWTFQDGRSLESIADEVGFEV